MILKLKKEFVIPFKELLELTDTVFELDGNGFNITTSGEIHCFEIGRIYQKMIYDLKQSNGKELLSEGKGEISTQ